MRDNQDTDVDILQTRATASRGQATLCTELGITNQQVFNSGSIAANTGGGGASVSGSGVLNSLTGGTTGGGGQCPEINQFIRVRSDLNTAIPTLVRFIEVGMYLWSPISQAFEKVVYAQDVESDLWEVSDGRVSAVGSPSHPIISFENEKGVPFKDCKEGLGVPAMYGAEEHSSTIKEARYIGKGIVKKIETEGPTHVYCSGSGPLLMFWFHNLKPAPDEL